MYSRRDVSPNMLKAVRWFSRLLWFLLIIGLLAAIFHGRDQSDRADRLEQERDQLKEELKVYESKSVKSAAPEKVKPDGRTIP